MKSIFVALMAGLLGLLVTGTGCKSVYPYENYTTYGATRRLNASSAPKVTKVAFSPFIFIPETIAAPVTVYMDCAESPPTGTDGHIYLSYIGTKTLRATNLRKGYKVCAGVPTIIVDTLWFPVAGIKDTIFVLSD